MIRASLAARGGNADSANSGAGFDIPRHEASENTRPAIAEIRRLSPNWTRTDLQHRLLGALLVLSWAGFAAGAQQRRGAVETGEAPQWVKPPVEAVHVQHHTFQSRYVNGPVSYLIYLPPDYETSGQRYPVMYWLHGRGGAQTGIPGFAGRLTAAIQSGKAPAMIVVFVNGLPTGGYRDSADGKQPVESVTIKELIPHIDATYRTIAARESRLVEGFSMGGSGAAKWGFKFPELFGSFSVFAGALHGSAEPAAARVAGLELSPDDDPWKLAEKNAGRVRGNTVARITVGSRDGLSKSNTAFHELLDRLKIGHKFAVIDGVAHSPWPLYDALGDQCWAFYYEAFRMKPGAPGAAVRAPAVRFSLQGEKWSYEGEGLSLTGILLKPEGAGPFPAIVISHGMGGNADGFAMQKAREMVKWGFVSIGTNYTHAGPRRPDQPRMENSGASAENIKRAEKCIQILESLPYVDAKRICAYGNSMGAFLTVALAASRPEKIRAAAITAGGISERGGSFATREMAEKIRCPFLILHGGSDRTVNPESSVQLKEILDRNKTPNKRVVFEGIGHNAHSEKAAEVNALMREWFTEYQVLR